MKFLLPYVYKLTHKVTKKFYIGYRSQNKTHSTDDLGIVYFTSCRSISKDNFDEYSAEIIAEFFTAKDAYEFEQELIFSNWFEPLLINKSCYHNKHQFRNKSGYTLSEEQCATRSRSQSGSNNSMFGKTGPNSPLFGRKRPDHSKKMTGIGNPMYNKHHTQKVKDEHSKRMKGSIPILKNKTYEEVFGNEKAADIKEKLRKHNLGKTVPKKFTQCPHCGKIGLIAPMARWHFNKCSKFNPE